MQAAEGPISPFIFDSDMGENAHDPDLDFEFFDTDLPLEAPPSPGIFLPEDLTTDSSQYPEFGSPKIRKHPNPLINTTTFLGSSRNNLPVLSATTVVSPAASSQGSSSVSSRSKRKASGSDSSQSALTPGDTMMADDSDMKDWKVDDMMTGGDVPNYSGFNGSGLAPFNGTIDPSKMSKHTFDFTDKSMENDFDFESAASSPSPFETGQSSRVDSPEMPTIRFDKLVKNSPKIKTQFRHNKANSQHSMTNSMNGLTTMGSREASPLSAMVTSQESSPSAFFNSPSPSGGGVEYIQASILSAVSPHTAWPPQFSSHNGLPAAQFPAGHPSAQLPNPQNIGHSSAGAPPNSLCKPRLTIHPTPLKSRVETQIPIKVTLFPMPQGITKLHLPKHTISKPKLLSKPPPEQSPDTLELSTMLVCSSAMQNPDKRRKAFARAAKGPPYPNANSRRSESQNSEVTADEDDESKPLNGGEVQICGGCITRERKRAARKKVKKAEDEDAWHKDEHKRVIVFNTHEIKDWQAPSSQPPSEATGDRAEPMVPEGAMQVDAPMRIACYCRHQNEKLGFQVIFTIKDHLGRLVAQEITSSIMITDDHKTHNMPSMPSQDSNGSDGMGFPTQGSYPTDPAYNMLAGPANGMAPFRVSHSSSDLQGLKQQQYPVQYQQHGMNANSVSHPSQSTSGSMTPRNLSRQGSPSGSIGPSCKKRKASGSVSKVPTGLAMTKMENSQPAQNISSALPSAGMSSVTSPFTPAFGSFQQSPENQFNMSIPPATQQFNTGPPTPNSNDHTMLSNANRSHSMENLAGHQMYSAPASARPSRAPSPNGLRHQAYQQQAQIAQAVANGLYGMPLSLNPHRPPTIHKLIPFEGPKAGGIEVTCLGSGFCQGLEVMFGENKATTTTYWGETSLVCLLPPAAFAGTVAVTFKHQHQQVPQFPAPAILPKQQVLFKYIDDDEQQIIRTALSVLHHKMTGKMEDVRDLARRIVGDGPSSWISNGQNGSGTQVQHGANFGSAQFEMDLKDVEGSLLRVLDLIDLDDSPYAPRLNYRRSSGQTMLHLACSLGLHRFVAALLARGANAEPRDKGGFTPMHFAALHDHPQIVRRLILCGADPTMRSLLGYTPADLATSEEVLRATRRIEYHSRTRSNGSIRSRTSSIASLRSLWEPLSITQSNVMQGTTDGPEDGSTASENDDDDPYNPDDEEDDGVSIWRRSSHANATRTVSGPITSDTSAQLAVPEAQSPPAFVSTAAAMAAFREQMSAHFQHIQQTMHLNFSNLPPMQMPTLPDYQAYLPTNPVVRRISSMVPHMGATRPSSVSSTDGKEHDYTWWDLFSGAGAAAAAPPAYDDIFPDKDMATKRSSAAQAAADAVADDKCAILFDQVQSTAESSTAVAESSTALETVHIGRKHPVSQEVQAKLRLAHAEKVKRIKSDRNLFFIWIPLLVVVIFAMGYNKVPQLAEFLRNRFNSQAIGVQ